METLFRGIFLTSDNPEATARFYREVARQTLEQVGKPGEYVYWKIDQGGVQIAIHDAAKFAVYTSPALSESNLTHLYFRIDSIEQFILHLKTLDIEPWSSDDVVITVVDPDGRKVMFGTA